MFGVRLVSVDHINMYMQLFAGVFHTARYLTSLNYISPYGETLEFSATQGTIFIGMNNGISAMFKVILGFLEKRYIGRLHMDIICCATL
jgi:hypothetical protein